MADTLLIYYNPAEVDSATWSLVNNTGELTSMISRGALSDAAAIAEKHKVVVLLDNTRIHINSLHLPVKNHQKLLRAVPYALEELIADDIDGMHFVVSKPQADGSVAVASIKNNLLETILAEFNNSGINPDAIIPDTLCLTANLHQWSILLYQEQANVQFGHLNGGEFDRDSLNILLSTSIQQDAHNLPEKIILFTPEDSNDAGMDETANNITALLPENIELIRISYNTHPLVVYCGQYKNAMPLNLLQDTYKPKRKGNVEWHRWRLAAALTIVWLCLELGSASVQYFELQEKNRELSARIEKIYKSTFPKSRKIVNARVQMEQKLNELKGGSTARSENSIVDLLSNAAIALSSTDKLTLQEINYRNYKIDLELTGTDLQAIENLNKKLNNKYLKAEIVSSSAEKNQVKGSIRIQGADS